MHKFKRTNNNGFSYTYEEEVAEGATVIVAMPTVSANKRSVNDIGWMTDGENVELYGTLSSAPKSSDALWQRIASNDDINKTVTALKIVNKGDAACKVVIKALLC